MSMNGIWPWSKVSKVGRISVEAYPGKDFASATVASIGDVVDPDIRNDQVACMGG